jgi:Bacteriophage Lambda NinG protein
MKETKKCKKCKETKLVESMFNRAYLTKDGFSNTCASCEKDRQKENAERYKKNAYEKAKLKQIEKRAEVRQIEPRPKIALKPQSELDRLFSLIIRNSHPNFCHSCGKSHEVSESQCGHYIPRGNFSVRYDLRNALPVCVTCNYFVSEHVQQLEKRLIELYGEDVIDTLQIKKIELFKATPKQKEWLEKVFSILLKSLTDDTDLNIEKLKETQRNVDLIFCDVV